MNIFFTASIRGGRAQQPVYNTIVHLLQEHGAVLSGHIADEALSKYGETNITKEEVHDRELAAMNNSDVVVAEVSTPSLGVGYVIARATQAGKPVICLFQGEDTLLLSAMIKGDKGVVVYTYTDTKELPGVIETALADQLI